MTNEIQPGDLVYCPHLGGEIFEVVTSVDPSKSKLHILHKQGIQYFNENGEVELFEGNFKIAYRVQKNEKDSREVREALELLYPQVKFETYIAKDSVKYQSRKVANFLKSVGNGATHLPDGTEIKTGYLLCAVADSEAELQTFINESLAGNAKASLDVPIILIHKYYEDWECPFVGCNSEEMWEYAVAVNIDGSYRQL